MLQCAADLRVRMRVAVRNIPCLASDARGKPLYPG